MADSTRWHSLPPIELPTPLLSLLPPAAESPDGPLWIGGVGGVAAWWPNGVTGGEPSLSDATAPVALTLGLSAVAALCRVGGWLVAGGSEGIVRWRESEVKADGVLDAEVEVADVQSGGAMVAEFAVVTTPTPAERQGRDDEGYDDPVLLAATLGDGVLRSLDRGRTWSPAGFGLEDPEVCTLFVTAAGLVLAGTATGIFAATPGVRAWRRCPGSEGLAISSIVAVPSVPAGSELAPSELAGSELAGSELAGSELAGSELAGSEPPDTDPPAIVVAACESGEVLRSTDGGRTWAAGSSISQFLSALGTAPDSALIAGTADRGIWRSADGALTWTQVSDGSLADGSQLGTVYGFASHADRLYAGTTEGLATSDDGMSWRALPAPLTHDFDRLLVGPDARPVVAGSRTGLVQLGADGAWDTTTLAGEPFPLSGVAMTPEGTLLAADPSGLYRYGGTDAAGPGQSWICQVEGTQGHVGVMAFGPDGFGLAAPARHGDHLLRTTDGGATWQAIPAPFGVLPVRALQISADMILAATSDPRHEVVQLWASIDEGETWHREARADTPWPLVLAVEDPPGLSLGRALFTRDADGRWLRWADLDDGIRAVTMGRAGVIACTAGGIWPVSADGTRGERLDAGLPAGDVLDLHVHDGRLYALMTGGRVCWRDLRTDSSEPASDLTPKRSDYTASTKR